MSNRLKVQFPDTVVMPEDQKIQENVEGAIGWDPDLDETTMRVSYRDGAVKLAGSVDAAWKKDYVERLASNVPGVRDVENGLTIVPTKDVLDERISEEIIAALKRNRLVDEEEVDVEVVDGTVILGGEVPSPAAETAVYYSALYTVGCAEDKENDVRTDIRIDRSGQWTCFCAI